MGKIKDDRTCAPDRLDSLALFAYELECYVGISRLLVLSLPKIAISARVGRREESLVRLANDSDSGSGMAESSAKYFPSERTHRLTHPVNLNGRCVAD